MVFEIGGYRVGGLLGENPTWVIATIFYTGDKYLLNQRGEFDKKGLSEKIQEALSTALSYNLVLGIDVVIPSAESIHNILTFLAEYEAPLLLNSPDPSIRAKSYLAAKELGLEKYAIANGIYVNSTREEIDALRESGLGKAVLIAFDPSKPYETIHPERRIMLVEETLLPLAKESGINVPFIDFVVLDPGSIALCGEAIRVFKEKYNYPTGCAPANALGSVSKQTVTIDELYGVHGGSAAYLRMMGADFIMVGPLGRVKYVAPIIAMVDGLLGYSLRRRGIKLPEEHPMKTLLRKVQRLFTQPTLPGG